MIRLALTTLGFVAGVLLLIGGSWNASHNLAWQVLGNGEVAKAAAGAALALAVALLLCFPLVRRLVRKRRWVVAATVVAPLVLLTGVIGVFGGLTAAEIHECERAAFPLLECGDWHDECRHAGNCAYKPYWQARLRGFFREEASLWQKFQIEMHNRHVARGWVDATDPEHVRAVDDDWGLAWEASRRGLLPDPASLGEP